MTKNEQKPATKNEIVVYQPNETVRLEVRLDDETVWLTQSQMAELFGCSADNIGLHLKNIYRTGELVKEATAEESSVVRKEGSRTVSRRVVAYNLDAIISVGYRVNSVRGVQFRQWATGVLREYLLRGYSFNAQYGGLTVRTNTNFHDRFLIIDDKRLYLIGASLKDLGWKCFAFTQLDASEIPGLKARL